MNELITLLMGALPITEVRGAIPAAIFGFGFAPLKAYLLGVGGNLLPILPVLFVLQHLSAYLMRKSYWVNRFLTWLFQYTRHRHARHFSAEGGSSSGGENSEATHEHIGFWREFGKFSALFVFVAVPLPLTGVWSGILAAYVFDLPFWRSAIALAAGVAAAGLIVLSISLGISTLSFF
jgi:uncharacterized membrane protein